MNTIELFQQLSKMQVVVLELQRENERAKVMIESLSHRLAEIEWKNQRETSPEDQGSTINS